MEKKRNIRTWIGDIVGILVCFFVFVIPFLFMLINSLKERREANKLSLALPSNVEWNNFIEVIQTNDYQIFNAFKNSILLTAGAVLLLVICSSMAGYVIQRRNDRPVKIASTIIMTGLMIPAAVLPTIWVMRDASHLQNSAGNDSGGGSASDSIYNHAVPRIYEHDSHRAGRSSLY